MLCCACRDLKHAIISRGGAESLQSCKCTTPANASGGVAHPAPARRRRGAGAAPARTRPAWPTPSWPRRAGRFTVVVAQRRAVRHGERGVLLLLLRVAVLLHEQPAASLQPGSLPAPAQGGPGAPRWPIKRGRTAEETPLIVPHPALEVEGEALHALHKTPSPKRYFLPCMLMKPASSRARSKSRCEHRSRHASNAWRSTSAFAHKCVFCSAHSCVAAMAATRAAAVPRAVLLSDGNQRAGKTKTRALHWS